MIDLVASRESEIAALCRRHGVRALWLFGSAAKGTWDASSSDLDFLVDLGKHDACYARRLMRTIVDLESLFGVRVDVTTTEQAISDWFRQELDATKELLFESERASVAG
jgi:predicted nucleotidyltransferase